MSYHDKYNSDLKLKKNFKLHKLFRYATNVLHSVNKAVGIHHYVLLSSFPCLLLSIYCHRS